VPISRVSTTQSCVFTARFCYWLTPSPKYRPAGIFFIGKNSTHATTVRRVLFVDAANSDDDELTFPRQRENNLYAGSIFRSVPAVCRISDAVATTGL